MTEKELKQFDATAKKLIHLTCNAQMHEVTFDLLRAAIQLLGKARAKEEDYCNELTKIRSELH